MPEKHINWFLYTYRAQTFYCLCPFCSRSLSPGASVLFFLWFCCRPFRLRPPLAFLDWGTRDWGCASSRRTLGEQPTDVIVNIILRFFSFYRHVNLKRWNSGKSYIFIGSIDREFRPNSMWMAYQRIVLSYFKNRLAATTHTHTHCVGHQRIEQNALYGRLNSFKKRLGLVIMIFWLSPFKRQKYHNNDVENDNKWWWLRPCWRDVKNIITNGFNDCCLYSTKFFVSYFLFVCN